MPETNDPHSEHDPSGIQAVIMANREAVSRVLAGETDTVYCSWASSIDLTDFGHATPPNIYEGTRLGDDQEAVLGDILSLLGADPDQSYESLVPLKGASLQVQPAPETGVYAEKVWRAKSADGQVYVILRRSLVNLIKHPGDTPELPLDLLPGPTAETYGHELVVTTVEPAWLRAHVEAKRAEEPEIPVPPSQFIRNRFIQ